MTKGGEPQKKSQGGGIDTSNLVMTRSAERGTALEVELNSPSYGSNNKEQKDHDNYMSAEEARQHIMRITGLHESEAEKTREAIERWSGSGYSSIRAVQQGQFKNEKARIQGNRLERFIERAPKWAGKITYRGIKLKNADIAKLKVGESFNMLGTSSWSSSFEIAKGFSSGRAVFVSKTQTKGTSIKFHSGFSNEKEILVSKKAEYTISKIRTRKDGLTVVWLEEKR